MGKETNTENSKLVRLPPSIEDLQVYLSDSNYKIMFDIKTDIAKMNDDSEVIEFLEKFKKHFWDHDEYGIPFINVGHTIKEKCMELVIEPELEWRKNRVLEELKQNELGLRQKSKSLPTKQKVNDISIKNCNIDVQWAGSPTELIELLFALIEAGKLSGKNKTTIVRQLWKYFNMESKAKSDPFALYEPMKERKLGNEAIFLKKLQKIFTSFLIKSDVSEYME